MKLSELASALYKDSDFESVESLGEYLDVSKEFIRRFFKGKNTTEKLDLVFEELTKEFTVADFMSAIELIRQVRLSEIEKKQIL